MLTTRPRRHSPHPRQSCPSQTVCALCSSKARVYLVCLCSATFTHGNGRQRIQIWYFSTVCLSLHICALCVRHSQRCRRRLDGGGRKVYLAWHRRGGYTLVCVC